MKIKILQENLQTALNYLQKAIPTRPSLPVLSSILITAEDNQCTLAATDLYFGVKAKIDSQVNEKGSFVVPGKELREIIQSLPAGEVEMSYQDGSLKISSKQTTSTLQCQTGEEFPQFPEIEGDDIKLSSEVLNVISDKVIKSVSTDQTRPILTGVLLEYSTESLRAVGTDGFRLSVADFESSISAEYSLVVPGKVLDEVNRIAQQQEVKQIDYVIDQENKQILFKFKDVDVFTRLIDGEYPPYQKIIPSSFVSSLKIEAENLAEQVKRAQVFAKNSSNIVQIDYSSDGGVNIKATSPSIGSFEGQIESAEVDGDSGLIAFNAKYILDYLQQIEEDEITIQISGELKPALFSVKNQNNYSYIVMPFRVNS